MSGNIENISMQRLDGYRPLDVLVSGRRQVSYGGEEPKYEVSAHVLGGDGGGSFHFFEKLFSGQSEVNEYVSKCIQLRDARVITVPVIGYTQSSVYLVDMHAHGWEFYGKSRFVMIDRQHKMRNTPQHDAMFHHLLHPGMFRQIKKSVEETVQLASRRNILLPWDDPLDLLIHTSGVWHIGPVDVINTRADVYGGYGRCLRENTEYAKDFINGLKYLRRIM